VQPESYGDLMFWLCRGGRSRSPLDLIGCASREHFQAIMAKIRSRWQAISAIAAGIGAPDDPDAAMGARGVDCRSDLATTWRVNKPCRVTTAPRLLRERGAARAAASSARRSR